MRRNFARLTHELMSSNTDVFLLTADLGFGMWDKVRKDFPERAINVGAAEQLMVGAAVGLALSGKIPICYSITPFLLYRPFELIRNYLQNENVPVKLIGSGRDKDYSHDGFSHWAEEDADILQNFHHIEQFYPRDIEELLKNFERYILLDKPTYINLRR